jgi:hypothetical protein
MTATTPTTTSTSTTTVDATTTPATPKPVGRPTKYDPAFCDKARELGAMGYSKEMISAELNVGWNTLNLWADNHPDFMAALEEAKTLEMVFFEKLALMHLVERPQGDRLNTGLWSRSMAARFPKKYRENSKMEVVGKDDGPVQIDTVHDIGTGLVNDLLAIRQKDADNDK